MLKSEFFNLTKRKRKKRKEHILKCFSYTITLIKKQEAFDKIKFASDRKKNKWKYKVFTEVENTFYNLGVKMPWTIQTWLLED